jgi:capsular polysaccharide biosynthesis protein
VEDLEQEINIKRLINLIKKRIWIVIVTTILSSIVGTILSVYYTPNIYESSSRMIVNAEPNLMNTLMVMIKEPSFLEHVVIEMDLEKTPEQLSQQISAGSIGGTTIVKITVLDSNPEMAANIANTTAKVFKREMPNILGFSNIRIFSEAKINNQPINSDHEKKIVIAVAVGVIAGLGLIFLLDFFDNTVKAERTIEQILAIPVLGSVSKMNKKNTAITKKERYKVEVWGESIGDSK